MADDNIASIFVGGQYICVVILGSCLPLFIDFIHFSPQTVERSLGTGVSSITLLHNHT